MRQRLTCIVTLTLTATVLSVLPVPLIFAATITNGSFEDVQIGSVYHKSSDPSDVPGWTHLGDTGEALIWRKGYIDCCGSVTTAGDGNQFVTLGGGYNVPGSASWSTTITDLIPGDSYDLSFMTANEGDGVLPLFSPTPQIMTVGFSSGSSTPSQAFTGPLSSANYWRTWVAQNYSFVPTATSAEVVFSVKAQPYDMGLDAVHIAATKAPEPSSVFLLGTGLLALTGMVRSRFRR